MATHLVQEKETTKFTATITDEAGAVLASASISALTLTLYDHASGDIINSRNAQDVKDTNNVTIHATSGLMTWTSVANDHVMSDTTKEYELHVALFEWTFSSKTGRHEILMLVRNLTKVT